jgi:hypothetical protein
MSSYLYKKTEILKLGKCAVLFRNRVAQVKTVLKNKIKERSIIIQQLRSVFELQKMLPEKTELFTVHAH